MRLHNDELENKRCIRCDETLNTSDLAHALRLFLGAYSHVDMVILFLFFRSLSFRNTQIMILCIVAMLLMALPNRRSLREITCIWINGKLGAHRSIYFSHQCYLAHCVMLRISFSIYHTSILDKYWKASARSVSFFF